MATDRATFEPPAPKLTERMITALELASNGYGLRETAAFMGVSVSRVKQLRDRFTWELGGVNTTHAVAIALRQGLID